MIKRKKKKRRLQGNIIMSMESGINFLMTTCSTLLPSPDEMQPNFSSLSA
jgi:hypothetical protein